jgi:hypothetical protein
MRFWIMVVGGLLLGGCGGSASTAKTDHSTAVK